MSMLRHWSLLIAPLLACAACTRERIDASPATEPQASLPSDPASMLHDADPARVAWAAYTIGSRRLDHLHDAVVERLEEVAADADLGQLRGTLADALVRLERSQPDPALVATLLDHDQPVPALILASRRRDGAAGILLPRLEGSDWPDDSAWQAAANLLLRARPPGLAAALLRMTIALRVEVHYDIGAGWVSGGTRYSTRLHRGRPGYPPLVRYELTVSPMPGDVVLAPGPQPVFWRRQESPDGGLFCAASSSRLDRDAYRLRLIAALLGQPEQDLGLTTRPRLDVVWTDSAAFTAAVADERTRLASAWRRLTQRLIDAQLLAADAAPPLPLRITVEDVRRDEDRSPLPAVPDSARVPTSEAVETGAVSIPSR